MKYVAFLDILGFKNKLKGLSQNEARSFMGKFSSIVYHDFQVKSEEINGLVVSDSVVLSTKDVKQDSLKSLVNLVLLICKDEFAQNGILLRGAIAKGEFDEMPARELKNLRKELIVGQAYVDAYLLENSVKTIGINLSKDVYDDLQNCDQNVEITEEKIKKETHYVLKYITAEYLCHEDNLKQFVKFASDSNWLPHYYNTLYFALKNEKNDKKVEQVFRNLLRLVCDGKPTDNWRPLDAFIKYSFHEDVIENYQKRFLKHIRNHLFKSEYDYYDHFIRNTGY